jgi:hypothetical protein
LGIERLDGSVLVRDPILEVGSSLVCVGNVLENSVVYLLTSTPQSLIGAATNASEALAPPSQNFSKDQFLILDCISRDLFLQSRFLDELKACTQSLKSDFPVIGALTLGEIAGNGRTLVEFHNKTILIANLGSPPC